jgi:endonuclease/exonuclease/phosphatase family metal-dependent hydrolase
MPRTVRARAGQLTASRWLFALALCSALPLLACSSGEDAPRGSASTGGNGQAGGGAGATSGGGAGGTSAGTAGSSGAGGGASGSGGGGGSAGQAGSGGSGGSGGTGGAPMATELRITTSNIRYGTANDGVNAWDKRRELLFTVLKAQSFDSAGMQEVLDSQAKELDTALSDYARVGVGRDDGKTKGEYSPIFYKKAEYEAVTSGTFWFSDTPEVPGSMSWGNTLPRICTWARLKNLKTGSHYYHFNVHLDHISVPSRQKSSQLLAARIVARPDQADPVILTGDFNAEPVMGEELTIPYLLGTAKIDDMQNPFVMVDAWLKLHPGDMDDTTHHSFMGGTNGGIHIDYIFYGPGVSAKSAEIVRTHEGDVYPSDHYPVSAVLTLAP